MSQCDFSGGTGGDDMSTRQVLGALCSIPPGDLVNCDDLDRCLRASLSTSSGLRDVITSGAGAEVTYPCSSLRLSRVRWKGGGNLSFQP